MNTMNRVTSVMAMHTRDRVSWFVIPASVLGAGFVIVLFIAVAIHALWGSATPVYTGALAVVYFVIAFEAVRAVVGTFPFAVGYGARRRDYLLGTLAWGGAICAAWAIALGLLSLIEADVITNWGVGLHFFHLPFFSDGAPLRQFCWSYYHDLACARSDPAYAHGAVSLASFWVSFVVLLFLYSVGLLVGSVYQRFGRVGAYILVGVVFLLGSVVLLMSAFWNWWGAIFVWLAQQTAAGLGLWLLPLIALCALASFALLRKAAV
jgi:hypothetical protein